MKLLGAVLILLSAVFFGEYFAFLEKDKAAYCRRLLVLLSDLSQGIAARQLPVDEILAERSRGRSQEDGFAFRNRSECVQTLRHFSKYRELSELMGKAADTVERLGKTADTKNELCALERLLSEVRETLRLRSEEVGKKALLYRKLGIIVGCTVCIVLL